jgi:hypothetical protein
MCIVLHSPPGFLMLSRVLFPQQPRIKPMFFMNLQIGVSGISELETFGSASAVL